MLDKNKLLSFIKNVGTFKTNIDIAFQGGEPLLAGIDFYQDIFSKTSKNVTFSVQTNATLIDETWCELFRKYDVLVGVSIDGAEEENGLRKYPNGEKSFYAVTNAISLLQKYKVKHNLVCVVSKQNIHKLDRVFDYFVQELHEKYLQFIPCLKTADSDFSLTTEEYFRYLQILFDKYYDCIVQGKYVSVRYFDELIYIILGQGSSQCGMNGHCERQLVIEADGSVYPCDFYCDEPYLLGTIEKNTCKELIFNEVSDGFTQKKIMEKCKKCKYYKLCQGGCKRQRQDKDMCEAVYQFLEKNINRLLYIANYVRQV